MDGGQEKFNPKLFAGTDLRALDIRFLVTGICILPVFIAFAVIAVLCGVQVIPSDEPIPVMIMFLFAACLALALSLFFLIIYGKSYKTAKYVFYNSEEVEAVPLDRFEEDLTTPPKAYVYGITYALLTRPGGMFADNYRVRCGEDDGELNVFHILNKDNEIIVKNLTVANMYRYEGYRYVRYTASYPFRKESEVEALLDMRTIKVRINAEKCIALYYKPKYAASGVENNHL